ncbi:MAG: MerR family transcriptional regulator [Clostridia bacterium]|nr:MerR family transcriptional regulator [Clostridia bacterium]
MTIKELEEALGMTRANIRFYEREGLLEPARQENGYRDYSEEDLETLRKIKLLRQLQFDLSEIRALQKGEKDLAAALGERETEFTRGMADLEAARTLCLRMEAEGAGYGDMDAAKYLDELERLSREGTRFPTLQADSLPTVNRPWVRFFARGIDYTLCMFILMALLLGVLRTPLPGGVFFSLAISYLAWLLMMCLETLLLATWGYTPGKWLFGLKVRDADGIHLSQQGAKIIAKALVDAFWRD